MAKVTPCPCTVRRLQHIHLFRLCWIDAGRFLGDRVDEKVRVVVAQNGHCSTHGAGGTDRRTSPKRGEGCDSHQWSRRRGGVAASMSRSKREMGVVPFYLAAIIGRRPGVVHQTNFAMVQLVFSPLSRIKLTLYAATGNGARSICRIISRGGGYPTVAPIHYQLGSFIREITVCKTVTL